MIERHPVTLVVRNSGNSSDIQLITLGELTTK